MLSSRRGDGWTMHELSRPGRTRHMSAASCQRASFSSSTLKALFFLSGGGNTWGVPPSQCASKRLSFCFTLRSWCLHAGILLRLPNCLRGVVGTQGNNEPLYPVIDSSPRARLLMKASRNRSQVVRDDLEVYAGCQITGTVHAAPRGAPPVGFDG